MAFNNKETSNPEATDLSHKEELRRYHERLATKAWSEGGGDIEGAVYRLVQLVQLVGLYSENGVVDHRQLTSVWPAFRMLRNMAEAGVSPQCEHTTNLDARTVPVTAAVHTVRPHHAGKSPHPGGEVAPCGAHPCTLAGARRKRCILQQGRSTATSIPTITVATPSHNTTNNTTASSPGASTTQQRSSGPDGVPNPPGATRACARRCDRVHAVRIAWHNDSDGVRRPCAIILHRWRRVDLTPGATPNPRRVSVRHRI